MSTAHPDRRFVEADTWTATGSKSEMLATFHDFCPRVQKLLNLVPEGEVLEWKLRVHTPLSSWIDHNVALVGDACHPTLPHLAQGAAQAVEDAAVLGVVLGKLKSKKDIHKALHVYQVGPPYGVPAITTNRFSGITQAARRLGGVDSGGQRQGTSPGLRQGPRGARRTIQSCEEGGRVEPR
jgi:hypothetical protein